MRVFKSHAQLFLLLAFCLVGVAIYLLAGNPVALFALPLVGMALTADSPRAYELGEINFLPVKASTKIYEGAAVGLTAGYARGLVAGDQFQGFAIERADNSAVATDGNINVKVRIKGRMQVTLTSVAVTDVGSKVYMSADGTFTLTASGNSQVGHVHRYVTTNTCVIDFYVTPA